MDWRLSLAIIVGQATGYLSRKLRLGGGTALPGVVAEWIEPPILPCLTAALPQGFATITGTNGKTTTSRMIATALRNSGYQVVHNRAGANLFSGITSALVDAHKEIRRGLVDIAVFEVDEATMSLLVQKIAPRVVVITNLFRDQLDRYGEVDFLLARWQEALKVLPPSSTVVLNGDDPLVAYLGESASTRVIYYGLEIESQTRRLDPHLSEARSCLRCGGTLRYSSVYYGHLGQYNCSSCNYHRPLLNIIAHQVQLLGPQGSVYHVSIGEQEWELRLRLPGLYNVYNALAAIGCCHALGIDISRLIEGLENFSAAFGRGEHLVLQDRSVILNLVKNPVGFQQVLRTVAGEQGNKTFCIIVNDKLADGTDVSWLWDVEFELLLDQADHVVVSGTRAYDLALRLKYAGMDMEKLFVEGNLKAALERALALTPPDQTLYILPTYTALLSVRAILQKMAPIQPFWGE